MSLKQPKILFAQQKNNTDSSGVHNSDALACCQPKSQSEIDSVKNLSSDVLSLQ